MAQDSNDSTGPKYLTQDDLNGALASQKNEMKKWMQTMQDQNKSLIESLQTTFGPKQEAPAPLSKQELSDSTSEMQKTIKILMDRDKQRDEQDKSMRMDKQLRDQLAKNGINSRSDLAMSHLKSQVSYDEDGQLVMKFDEIPYPIAEAVAKFAQTDQGKFLADPRDIRGSGGNQMKSPGYQPPAQQLTGQGGVPVFKDAKELLAYTTGQLGQHTLKY